MRHSQTTIPVPGSVTLMPCVRRRLSMPSCAQRRVNLATPSFNQMCQTGRSSTASHQSEVIEVIDFILDCTVTPHQIRSGGSLGDTTRGKWKTPWRLLRPADLLTNMQSGSPDSSIRWKRMSGSLMMKSYRARSMMKNSNVSQKRLAESLE